MVVESFSTGGGLAESREEKGRVWVGNSGDLARCLVSDAPRGCAGVLVAS